MGKEKNPPFIRMYKFINLKAVAMCFFFNFLVPWFLSCVFQLVTHIYRTYMLTTHYMRIANNIKRPSSLFAFNIYTYITHCIMYINISIYYTPFIADMSQLYQPNFFLSKHFW